MSDPVEVQVSLLSLLAESTGGQKRVQARGATVAEVLRDLGRRYPALGRKWLTEDGSVIPALTIHLNGREVSIPQGLDRAVQEGDTLTLLPVVAGG